MPLSTTSKSTNRRTLSRTCGRSGENACRGSLSRASSFFAFVVSNYWCHKDRIFSSASAAILAIWLAPVVVLALGALLVVSNPWMCGLIPESVTHFRLWSALKRHVGVYLLTGVSVCAGVALPLLYPDAFPAFPCEP